MSGFWGARRIWRKSLLPGPVRRRHHDAEHAANVEITRKTVTRPHSTRAIANTYFRFWVRINVSRSRRLHYHRFRGSLSNFSLLSSKRDPMLFPQCWRSEYLCQLCGDRNKFQYTCILRNRVKFIRCLSARDRKDFSNITLASTTEMSFLESIRLVVIVQHVLHSRCGKCR